MAHIIGDFYFQTENMAENKKKSLKWVLLHCLLYLVSMLLFTLPLMSIEILLGAFTASVLHSVIDILKYIISRNIDDSDILDRNMFFIDQLLHIIILFLISFTLVLCDVLHNTNYIFAELFNIIEVSEFRAIHWLCALLVIHKPANIIISKLIKQYKPEDEQEQEKDKKAGRFIGTLERIIILIFISINQYSAIGLVLTAKSIARYEKIIKKKNFAEYYLLGTLLSALIAIVTSYLL